MRAFVLAALLLLIGCSDPYSRFEDSMRRTKLCADTCRSIGQVYRDYSDRTMDCQCDYEDPCEDATTTSSDSE